MEGEQSLEIPSLGLSWPLDQPSCNIEWMNDLRTEDNKEAFTQCIAFKSSFRSPKNGGGAWEANEEYTWSWWLARCEGGEWKLMTWGY